MCCFKIIIFFAFPVTTCNMEVELYDAVYFVSENYLSAKNNFLRHLEKWLQYLLYNWRQS